MKKRLISVTLILLMCLSYFPTALFANLQSPVQGISENSIINHNTIGSGTSRSINPVVNIRFTPPIPTADTGGDPENTAVRQPSHYQVHISEYPSGQRFQAPATPDQLRADDIDMSKGIPVHDKTGNLRNGQLYRMTVVPYHWHTYEGVDGRQETRWAPQLIPISSQPFQYVLTDFDTRLEGKEASINVTWEDAGHKDIMYRIGYVQGNYEGNGIDQIPANNIEYITPADIKENAEVYTDPGTGRRRFRYTIDNNIATGQMYSAFVVSDTRSIEGRSILANNTSPKIATATTQIGLQVFNIGKDRIRLEWNAQLPHLMEGAYTLEQTLIKEFTAENQSGRVIATLHKKAGADLGYYEYREPSGNAHYQLEFIYKKGGSQLTPEPKTAKILYVPGEMRVKPLTPEIPKPISSNTEVTPTNKGDFLVPGDKLPDIPLTDMWKSKHTFHANMSKRPTLNIVWSAHSYMTDGGLSQVDQSVLYDISVTDDIAIANSELEPIVENLSFYGGQNPEGILYNSHTNQIVGFRHEIGEYYNTDMKRLPLVANKVYYVKIIAKKQFGSEYEQSLPVVVGIMFDADGEVFVPPTISKPPLKLDEKGLGKESVTISWLESWHEILAKKPQDYKDERENKKAKEWNSRVYTKKESTTGPAISFIGKEGESDHILKTSQDMARVKSIIKDQRGESYYGENYLDRFVSLGKNVNYQYKMLLYQDVLAGLAQYNSEISGTITVEEYIEDLMVKDSENPIGWKEIKPKTVEDKEYVKWKQHKVDQLQANTSYLFFVKPYTLDYDGSKLYASLPTWINITTLPDGEVPEGKPTVPVLSLHGKGDNHISVAWEYNSEFDYEIRYSRLEDPEQGEVWPVKISSDIDDPNYVTSGAKAIVTIDDLFPDTTYNVWIRAKQKTGDQQSTWSNPVTSKTDILGTPSSPSGLGIASYQSILEIEREFQPVSSNHITVEWQRNAQDKELDTNNQDGQRVLKQYKYQVELADNPEFVDGRRVTVSQDTVGKQEESVEILSRNMVSFGGLIANRPYYVRAKTILIAQDQESNREIILESDYTGTVRILSKTSQDEYGGGDKINEVIYPEKITETYDGTRWTYEILDTQKIISEMLLANQYRYLVAMERYRGYYNPKYRTVKIPMPVITTLINRGMELEVRTNILSIQIPAKALETYIADSDSKDMLEFTFETLSESDIYGIGIGHEYQALSAPEKMTITLKGKSKLKALTQVDQLIKVKIKMPHQTDYIYQNMGAYAYDGLNGVWKKGKHSFDKNNMQLSYETGTIGSYAVYALNRNPGSIVRMSPSMQRILMRHDILGLGTKYMPEMQVNTQEYINIMLGLAEGRDKIMPDVGPTAAERERALRSGLYIGNPNSDLTQEAAIHGIIRLYELNMGMAIRPQTSRNVANVNLAYRPNVNKAYDVGLIQSIRPKAAITYQELFDLIEQVIE